MIALITGASSGIGLKFAKELSNNGYDIILVSRNCNDTKINNKQINYNYDLSKIDQCEKLYEEVKHMNIDLLVNCAGCGVYGYFKDINIDDEINMININVMGLHFLTKLFYKKFINQGYGKILNIASSAAFQPGPLMASYYATKAYVYNLTMALYEENRTLNNNIHISVLCPGPVNTNFNKKIGIISKIKPMESNKVVRYALKSLKRNKVLIIPGLTIRISYFFQRFIPIKLLLRIVYRIQFKKSSSIVKN